jgi:uncharacterized protein YgiM (DUF1202 family)
MSWPRGSKAIVRGLTVALVAVAVVAGSGVIPSGQASAQAGSGLYRVMKSGGLRAKPSKNGGVLVTVPRYAVVEALGEAKGCGVESCAWVKVAWDGYTGWTKGAYLEPALIVEGTMIAAEHLRLRATPAYDGEIRRVVPAGSDVRLTGRQSYPWVSVTYRGTKGWVHAEYLT